MVRGRPFAKQNPLPENALSRVDGVGADPAEVPPSESDDEAELAGIGGASQQRHQHCTLVPRDRVAATSADLATTSRSNIL